MRARDYPVIIEPLDPEDGADFVAYAPDLPGCTSDGETCAETAANVQDTIMGWIEAALQLERPIP